MMMLFHGNPLKLLRRLLLCGVFYIDDILTGTLLFTDWQDDTNVIQSKGVYQLESRENPPDLNLTNFQN